MVPLEYPSWQMSWLRQNLKIIVVAVYEKGDHEVHKGLVAFLCFYFWYVWSIKSHVEQACTFLCKKKRLNMIKKIIDM